MSQNPTTPTPLILERTRFGWRVKAPRITTPLVWRLVPIPVTLQCHSQPPAPAAQPTPRRLLVSPPHRADPAFSPASPRTQRRPKKVRKALKRENLDETIHEELEAASQKVIRLTRYILGLQNRLPTTKPSSARLTNIRKKRTELYKLCRTLRRTLSSEAENGSDSGRGSSETNWPGPNQTSGQKLSSSSSSSDASCSGLRPGGRSSPAPTPRETSSEPLLVDRELRSLTEQLRQDLQLPQLQVEVLDLSLGRRALKDSGLDKA